MLEKKLKGKVIGHEHLLGKRTFVHKQQKSELEQLLPDIAKQLSP